ncbi:MAG TPA: VOC family protein [Propionibacteriaceae bacterium]|nr:VOC family protein [Propionibacteriaceae bacterium]
MDRRVSFITLAVADLARSRAFYRDGLGWEPRLDGDEVLMFAVADKVVLSLWDVRGFADEVGYAPVLGQAPITLAHNMPTPDGVDEVLETARRAGATDVRTAVRRDWGGYSGYFADPDGYRWEVAHNPTPLGEYVLD